MIIYAWYKTTGCSNWKLTKVYGCRIETVHIWPYVENAKLCLRDSRFFSILEILFTIFSCLFPIFSKKLPSLKHILASPTYGQICTVSVLQPFTFKDFQSECPVILESISEVLNFEHNCWLKYFCNKSDKYISRFVCIPD